MISRHRQVLIAIAVWAAVTVPLGGNLPASGNTIDTQMVQRIERVRPSVVRVIVDSMPAGTGFVIAANGLVATCFHVVEKAIQVDSTSSQFTHPDRIQVEFHDGRKLPASLALRSVGAIEEAMTNDYAILRVGATDLTPLKLGSFSDVREGSIVYIAGFPLGIHQPVFAIGILSTKWRTTLDERSRRPADVAWLDITMNAGNSGGPVLLLSDSPDADVVVGLANFNLNPFARPACEIDDTIKSAVGMQQRLMGVDFKEFVRLVSAALSNNSLGVGGCVSVDYLREAAN